MDKRSERKRAKWLHKSAPCRILRRIDKIDCFNLDQTLAHDLYYVLTIFKGKELIGCPGGMTDEEWNTIFDEMVWAFKQIKDDYPEDPWNGFTECGDSDERKRVRDQSMAYQERVSRGCQLFGEYFRTLWI